MGNGGSYQKVIDSIFASGGEPDRFVLNQREWNWLPDSRKRVRAGKKEILIPHMGRDVWFECVVSKPVLTNDQTN